MAKGGFPAAKLGARLETVKPHLREAAALLSDEVDCLFVNPDDPADGARLGVFLHGGPGVGKTWLACATARAACERLEWSVGYVTVRDLLAELQACYQAADGDETVASIMRKYRRPRVLVLNELPTVDPRKPPSSWVVDQVTGIVNARGDEDGNVTITTGNLTVAQIADGYSWPLASRFGERVCMRIHVVGPDLRRDNG